MELDIRQRRISLNVAKKKNDSIVQIKSGEIGCITNILRTNKERVTKVLLLIRIFNFENDPFIVDNHVTIEHIKKCSNFNSNLKVIQSEDIISQYIMIQISNKYYISIIPKGCIGE